MKKLAICCAMAAAFVAAPASAQGYVGFGVGSSKISGADGTEMGFTYSGGNANRGSVKVFGGFQITPTWGAEAQYTDLGSRDVVETSGGVVTGRDSVRASQFSIAGTGTLPLSQSFALIGKLGVSQNRIKASGVNENKSDLLIGLGVSYSINPKMSVRAEYEDFGKISKNGGPNGGSIRASNYSVSLKYAF